MPQNNVEFNKNSKNHEVWNGRFQDLKVNKYQDWYIQLPFKTNGKIYISREYKLVTIKEDN